jgi:lipopolysaccharide transport system permease protein
VPRLPGRHFLRNLVERRALVAQLVRRDFQQRYVGSAAGWLWGIVHPLVALASYYFVFQVCLNLAPPKGFVGSYAVFIFTGFLPWLLFQETIIRSAGSLVDHANLITRTVFPSEVVSISIFLSSLIHHLIGAALAMLYMAWILKEISPALLLLPVYMFFVGLLAVGIGWIVSSLHVYLRDTGQVTMVALTLWLYLTPILISEETFRSKRYIKYLLFWNPMTWVVRGYRELLSARWPAWGDIGILGAYSISVFIIGGLVFRVLKRGFADVL